MNTIWHKADSRQIYKRLLIKGDLVLVTPAHFGGSAPGMVDMTLRLDPLEGTPVLRGTSLAGALRSYLRKREIGFAQHSKSNSLDNQLFGMQGDEDGDQSWLMIADALASAGQPFQIETRDGVRIEPATRTAADKAKFNFDLIEAGTTFPLRFELLVTQENEQVLRQACAIALEGFQRGEIPLGARTRRGFGRCHVTGWHLNIYDLSTPNGLISWLEQDTSQEKDDEDIVALLEAQHADLDQRRFLSAQLDFILESPMLIRSGSESGAADTAHLRSKRPGSDEPVPIISGTSLAGVLRSRAVSIAKTLSLNNAGKLVEDLFGTMEGDGAKESTASRVWVEESEIGGGRVMAGSVQNRIKIDRFTGGVYPGALFSEQPFFPDNESGVRLKLLIENPSDAEIGLLLLLIKDLWTGDLPIGGASSVGRGRLHGKSAHLQYYPQEPWTITEKPDGSLGFSGTSPHELETYVNALQGGTK